MLRQQPPTSGYSDQERDSSRPVVHAKTWTSASRPANVAQEAAARVLAGQKIGPERVSVSSATQPRPAAVVSASSISSEYGKQVGSVQMQSQSSPVGSMQMQSQSSPSGERFVQPAQSPWGVVREQLPALPQQAMQWAPPDAQPAQVLTTRRERAPVDVPVESLRAASHEAAGSTVAPASCETVPSRLRAPESPSSRLRDSAPTAAAHFQTAAYHIQQAPAQAHRSSGAQASSEAAPAPVFQAPSQKESHRSSDATPPRVNSSLPRQDSFVAPPGAPQLPVAPQLPGSEEVIVRHRPAQKLLRQDSLPTEADAGQTEVHPAHSRRFPSGRQLEAASPVSSFTRPSSSATSSQPLRESDRTGTQPTMTQSDRAHSQSSMQADPSRAEGERQSANEQHRRHPDGGDTERQPETIERALSGHSGHSRDTARRTPGTPGNSAPMLRQCSSQANPATGDSGQPAEQKPGSPEKRRTSFDAGQAGDPKLKADNQYLRRNVEHLRKVKHVLERHIKGLEARNQWLEQQMGQYKATLEQKQLEQQRDLGRGGGNVAVEIQNLNDQLEAVMSIKQALNMENEELINRLRKADEEAKDEVNRQGSCVICMDNLANVVCLPCKHLSMCIDCGQSDQIILCPICRVKVEDTMQIFCP